MYLLYSLYFQSIVVSMNAIKISKTAQFFYHLIEQIYKLFAALRQSH